MSLRVWLPLTKDLINQGLDDVAVTNHNATLNTAGKLGSCYYFNGSSQWLQLSNNLGNFYNDDWSVACWLKPTDSTRSVIISDYGGTGASNVAIELTAAREMRLYWNGSPDIRFSTAGALPLNEWTHIVITKAGRVFKLYFNGELKATTSTNSTNGIGYAANHCYVGAEAASSTSIASAGFIGKISDVRIYATALSADDIKSLYESNKL